MTLRLNAFAHFKLLINFEKLINGEISTIKTHHILKQIIKTVCFLCKLLLLLWMIYISINYVENIKDVPNRIQAAVVAISQFFITFEFLLLSKRRYVSLMKCLHNLQNVNELLSKCACNQLKNYAKHNFMLLMFTGYKTVHRTFVAIAVKHTFIAVLNVYYNTQAYFNDYALSVYMFVGYVAFIYCETFMATIISYTTKEYYTINGLLKDCSYSQNGVVIKDESFFVNLATCYGLLHDVLEEFTATFGLFTMAKWFIAFVALIAYPYEAIVARSYFVVALPWMIVNFAGLLGHLSYEDFIQVEVSVFKGYLKVTSTNKGYNLK